MRRWILPTLVVWVSACWGDGELEVRLFGDSNLYDDVGSVADAGWETAVRWNGGVDGPGRYRLAGFWRKHVVDPVEDAVGMSGEWSVTRRWAEGLVVGARLKGAAVFQYATLPVGLYDRQEIRLAPFGRWTSPGGFGGLMFRLGAGYEHYAGLPYSGPVWDGEMSGTMRPWPLTELEVWGRWERKDFLEKAIAVASNLFSDEARVDETVSWGGVWRQDITVFLGFEVSAEHRRVRSNGTLWVERVGDMSVRSVLTNAFGGGRWSVSAGWRWVPVLSVSVEGRVGWVSEVWNREALSFVGGVPVWSSGPVGAEGWEGEVVWEGRLAEGWTGSVRIKAGETVSADVLARYPVGFEVECGLRWRFSG